MTLSIEWVQGIQRDTVAVDSATTLGRDAATADIVIPDPVVSRAHARLAPATNEALLVEDLGSANGTYLNGRRIQRALIRAGDHVSIGDPPVAEFVLRADGQATADLPPDGSGRVALESPVIIGRAPGCDLFLPFPQISRRHTRVFTEANRVLVEDLDSANGTFVNGRRIDGPQELTAPATFYCASVPISCDGTHLELADAHDRVRVDAIDLTQRDGQGTVYLSSVSLSVLPGEFVGIVGPSGSGKTTLLETLLGLRPPTSGKVFVNKRDFIREFNNLKHLVGYVPQDDILHRQLTVAECLIFAARLRLPPDTSEAEIRGIVDDVLQRLEIGHIRDKQVQGWRERISGGQRKRVSIAMELITSPSLLFMDEPTSGLDPRVDRLMMRLFARLASEGHTVVVTTHSMENLDALKLLTVLTEGGRLAFFGPASDAKRYFEADRPAQIFERLGRDRAAESHAGYRNSRYFSTFVANRQSEISLANDLAGPAARAMPSHGIRETLRQLKILTDRSVRIKLKDSRSTAILLLQAPVIGVALALGFDELTGDNPAVLFVLVLASVWCGFVNASREVVGERPIFLRERMVNLKLTPYLMSKVTVLLGLSAVQVAILLWLVRRFNGLDGPLLAEWTSLFLVAGASVMLGLLISSLANSGEQAVAIAPILLIPQVILSGAITPLEGSRSWLSYLAFSRWGYQWMLELEKAGDHPPVRLPTGEELSFSQSIDRLMGDHGISATSSWTPEFALVVLGIGALAASYVVLARTSR